MDIEEKEKHKQKIKDNKKKRDDGTKLKYLQELKKKKEDFKKLSKEDQDKIKQKYNEFPYLEDLSEKQLSNLKKSKWIVVDPGLRTLMYMKSVDGTVLRYNNKEHLKKIKRLKYRRNIENYKKRKGITEIENDTPKCNSKTCKLDDFKKYIENKNKMNTKLLKNIKKTFLGNINGMDL